MSRCGTRKKSVQKKLQNKEGICVFQKNVKKDRVNCQVIDMTALGLIKMIHNKGKKPLPVCPFVFPETEKTP